MGDKSRRQVLLRRGRLWHDGRCGSNPLWRYRQKRQSRQKIHLFKIAIHAPTNKTLIQIQQDSTNPHILPKKYIRVIREICDFKAKPRINTNFHK